MPLLRSIPAPAAAEFKAYFALYVDQVGGADALATLRSQAALILALPQDFPGDREEYRYAPDKWNVRGVVGHMIDTERVFSLRALWFARQDTQPFPGWEQDEWAPVSNAEQRPLADLAAEFASVRSATLALLESFDESFLTHSGISDGSTLSVRAAAWIIAGHFTHHHKVLAERYAD